MSGRLVEIFSSFHAWETHLAQHALEGAGIESFIENENFVHANWLYANASGGVKLRVREEDAERALSVLREMHQTGQPAEMEVGPDGGPEEFEWRESDWGMEAEGSDFEAQREAGRGGDADDSTPRCPKCGSTNTIPAPWPALALIASYFLLGVPLLFRGRRCRECGEKADQ